MKSELYLNPPAFYVMDELLWK